MSKFLNMKSPISRWSSTLLLLAGAISSSVAHALDPQDAKLVLDLSYTSMMAAKNLGGTVKPSFPSVEDKKLLKPVGGGSVTGSPRNIQAEEETLDSEKTGLSI